MSDELVETVARAIALSDRYDWYNEETVSFRPSFRRNASAAIAVALEEAARVAEDAAPVCQDMEGTAMAELCDRIAAAIRALIPKEPSDE